MSYKDKYTETDFGTPVVVATRELMTHLWGSTKLERIEGIDAWLTAVSTAQGINKPNFIFIEGTEGLVKYQQTGGGMTIPANEGVSTIETYRKFSLTTILHEYRHCMQQQMEGLLSSDLDVEEDAREWSCSLYYVSDPARFMKAVAAHKLRFY